MLDNQSQLFNLPEDITYLNCSYMSPMLKSVAKVGMQGIYGKEDPTSVKPTDFFDNTLALRSEFAKLINTTAAHCAIVPSVSYGMANVAKNVEAGKGDNIVVADEQFPSNIYAWMALREEKGVEIKFVAPPAIAEGRGRKWNEQILDAIDSNTKLVSTGHVHWADGTLFDLEAIRARTKEVGALMVIDGTQSIGALPFDVARFQPDAVVASGYKWMMGPYSTAMAYYGDYFNDGRPIENNWMNRLHSEDFGNLINYQEAYQPGMVRYEVGESANFILTPMLTEAIRQINEWGTQNIQDYCQQLAAPFIQELRELGVQVAPEEERGHHLFGLRLSDAFDMGRVKNTFAERKIFVSVRGDSIRVSPNLYNSEKDLYNLVDSFKVLANA